MGEQKKKIHCSTDSKSKYVVLINHLINTTTITSLQNVLKSSYELLNIFEKDSTYWAGSVSSKTKLKKSCTTLLER